MFIDMVDFGTFLYQIETRLFVMVTGTFMQKGFIRRRQRIDGIDTGTSTDE